MSSTLTDPRILRGMEAQRKLRQDRLNSGEKLIGWKVGFGAPAALERLHLHAPLVGFLTDQVLLPSGALLSMNGWIKPALEPEVAVYLGRDLLGLEDRQTTREAIASIGPAIELADLDFPPEDVERILAEDIYNRHVILGRADASRAGGQLEDLTAHVYQNGEEIAKTSDLQALTGDIIEVLRSTVNLLSHWGEQLQAGELVMMGSIIPPLYIESTTEVRYTLDTVDEISVQIER